MFDMKTQKLDRQGPAFCPRCGVAMGEKSSFCGGCGAEVERGNPAPAATLPPEDPVRPIPHDARRPNHGDPEPTPTPLAFVPGIIREPLRAVPAIHCGHPMPEGALFCPFCAAPLVPQGPSYSVLAKTSGKPDRRFEMTGDDFIIGKTDQCHLRLPNDDFASRQHARIVRAGQQMVLEDLGSANGTFVRVRKPMAIEPGDEILIGTTVLRIEQNQG